MAALDRNRDTGNDVHDALSTDIQALAIADLVQNIPSDQSNPSAQCILLDRKLCD